MGRGRFTLRSPNIFFEIATILVDPASWLDIGNPKLFFFLRQVAVATVELLPSLSPSLVFIPAIKRERRPSRQLRRRTYVHYLKPPAFVASVRSSVSASSGEESRSS
jgi:hypothetical protein